MDLSLPDLGRERVLLYSALVRTNHYFGRDYY
jgi:hypothetical protein